MIDQIFVGISMLALGFFAKVFLFKYKERKRASGQRAIFSRMEKPTKFVFPPRENIELAILPRMSTEDFLAINNIISAFILAGYKPPSKVVDSKNITKHDKQHNNLILICSSKSNKATKEALDLIRNNNPRLAHVIPVFESNPETGRIEIKFNHATYPSESFEQKGPELTDIAVIVKSQSPWAGQYKILVVAGIRGIGTWGAAEFLKKWWKPLYDRKRSSHSRDMSKTGDFAAIVKVKYKEYDIKNVDLLNLVDLDDQKLRYEVT